MATELKFHFFGWSLDPSVNADKIWAWFQIDDKIYNVWGKRGEGKLKKLSFKQFTKYSRTDDNIYEVRRVQREKINKGYRSIAVTVVDDELAEIEKIYPGFTDHVKKEMFVAKLSGTIKNAESA